MRTLTEERWGTPIQGYRKFETVQNNRILNPKLSNERCKILLHFDKVSKYQKNVCTHPKRHFRTILSSFKTILLLKYLASCQLTVEHWARQPLDSLTQHWLTIGLLDAIVEFDTSFSNIWKIGHRAVRPLDGSKKHSLTIGVLENQITRHQTVGHTINQPLDCWTQHCPIIGQFDKTLSDNCPTIGMLDAVLSKHLHN